MQTGFAVDLALKDVGHMRSLARDSACPLPIADLVRPGRLGKGFEVGGVKDASETQVWFERLASSLPLCHIPGVQPFAVRKGEAWRGAGLGRDPPGDPRRRRAAQQRKEHLISCSAIGGLAWNGCKCFDMQLQQHQHVRRGFFHV